MSIPNEGGRSPYDELLSDIEEAVAKFKKSSVDFKPVCGSMTVETAIAYGLPPRMSYTVAEVGAITGMGEDKVRYAHQCGELSFIEPDGKRGARVLAKEVDRWMEAIA